MTLNRLMIRKFWNWLFGGQGVGLLSAEERRAIFCVRSGKWRKKRDAFLESNPCCAACGSTENLAVHHVVPVHVDGERELDETNFIVLCQNRTLNCHFLFGHLLNWSKYNQDVRKDAKIWREKLG